ncbi:MAG: STAS domain-containing protein [Prevotella sp.]|nr:STAS domain-containing protein [Prevotella sp.]
MNIQILNENGVYTGVLDGRLDTNAVADFAKDIQPLLEHADQHIILDCSKLEYIASSGLRIFLLLRKESAEKGGKVTLVNVSGDVQKVFKMVGFYSLFEIL